MDESYRRLIQRNEELAELRAIGDTMQSALSRLIAYAEKDESIVKFFKMGSLKGEDYEAMMAALEGKSAIEKWTEARKQSR